MRLPRVRWREVRRSWYELDPQLLSGRIAGAVLFVGGLLALAVLKVVPEPASERVHLVVAVGACVLGVIVGVVPWDRFEARFQLVVPFVVLVLVAFGGSTPNGPFAPFLVVLPLPFVFVGFTHRPGTATAMAPAAAIALLVAADFDLTRMLAATLLFALPISVLAGEAVAQAQQMRAHAQDNIGRLLQAVRVLAHVDDYREGAQVVAALAAELLEADAVSVLLADPPGGTRFLNRAWFGHPALADAAPLLVDGRTDHMLDPRAVRFFPDATRATTLAGAHAAIRSAALVPLPNADGAALGLVIAMWGTPRRHLAAPARQAGELLSQEAGRMFQRLRQAEALAHDAETDPLTELANRRTFARALTTLQPGDALVIVDLDHFKQVNDKFGHQVGDKTLRALAGCLRHVARQEDCVARYGGEEFALVLPDAGAAGATAVLRRVRDAWNNLHEPTTFSAGIAVSVEGENPGDVLARADAALYAAKDAGRDRDVMAEPELRLTSTPAAQVRPRSAAGSG